MNMEIHDMDIDIDMIMDVVPDFLEFSNQSNTTTPPTSDDDTTWSPLLDLDFFTTNQDDFHNFIDSLTNDEITPVAPNLDNKVVEQDDEEEEDGSMGDMSNSNSTTTEEEEDDRKGLRLVHLLMAAAEALTGTNKSHHLAQVILIRLKDLVSSTHGTNMERLAAYFTDALQTLLNGTDCGHHKLCLLTGPHQTDILSAFQLLQDMSPYVKFAHFTANQAILEAVTHERRVHIVDFDIMEGAQWASLIQSLSSRKEGLPGPHLRITALSRNKERGNGRSRSSFATVQETGRRLTTFAASVGQPFTFHQCRLESDETFRTSSLKLVRGEALVFNCVMHLPHLSYRASDSIASFLNGAKELGTKLVTLVEEEVGPITDAGFVGLFMDSLHRYSAMYDSFEAGFPMNKWARSLVEQVFLGPRIMGSVAQLYMTGEEEEQERGSWGEWLGVEGFKGVNISYGNHCQAKLLLGLFNDGYRVEELGNNKLVLGWKSRRLLSASVWTCMSEIEYDF